MGRSEITIAKTSRDSTWVGLRLGESPPWAVAEVVVQRTIDAARRKLVAAAPHGLGESGPLTTVSVCVARECPQACREKPGPPSVGGLGYPPIAHTGFGHDERGRRGIVPDLATERLDVRPQVGRLRAVSLPPDPTEEPLMGEQLPRI